ncbi:MAG TPA: NAD-dependent epimerase/dehydratase family protein [Kiritimatiellia bacterium]|jgi:nucleoside-diphosphate-sugar epimerase|nr:NAD-dependent epimerase/dehydratase family protein [Kiritimatiellia bacterium]OQC59829.1 MAG: UDP-glucose 4-epimerase [Verrucomicrobia bacterium ADurb.Bin018]MBP9571562.1 NAD-dependent epimerase/dehydratase family protein [Kiritimatiellia bacterium]HOE00762.1 NAD-dependent epimerase/dehydratase family protein [Kiritimatiellia bacterium]HOE36018.1 NAD-dependent epimerase/dehydratase family protein [Kiritimatiellia bacterium]
MSSQPTILVTGASGFLGGRLVEQLLAEGRWHVRAMAHRPGGAVRLARLGVEIAWTDLLKPDEVRAAVEGVAAVVHCAYGTDPRAARATTVDGTRNLLQAARAAQVKQVVHISTIGVHSYSPPPNVTEDSPCVKSRDDYCNAKIEAEQVVRNICPTATILRMGNIYGPWSLPWTVRPLAHIGEGKASVVDSGQHASNMVFIDNAVEAIRLSLATERAAGETFFITDDPCSWAEMYGAYATWLGRELRSVDSNELRSYIWPAWYNRWGSLMREIWQGILVPSMRYTAFRAAVSPRLGAGLSRLWQKLPVAIRYRLVGDPMGRSVPAAAEFADSRPATLPPAGLLELYAGRTVFSNEKAERVLGYGPCVTRQEALERTRLWAEWARLIGTT